MGQRVERRKSWKEIHNSVYELTHCMHGQIGESRRGDGIQGINGGCGLEERKDAFFSEMEEGT